MDSLRNWMDSIEQTVTDDYGFGADEAVKFSSDVFSDGDDIFDQDEPSFADLDD